VTGQKLELILEFSVILISPIVYHYYLWKYKKVDKKELIKNIKVFFFLYAILGLVASVLVFK